ncbi:hypothetical protein M408DRAFT_229530 [Serendipita vermifera MAFF 305830]|uniref:Uncharacterized protein n=1 Tax=Serendipita vermifera MAFF 305830 TaxID=933852 RepID=A0A0C2WED9_SERVB|nr:hypothetical protein M408DRAFT_229530 [Serendipita vermifera MAFF 305830]
MTYSHTWNNFFYDHFRIRISKGQTHVAIWAPESQICTSESLDPELRLYFGDELVYTNMDELEKSMPLDCPTEEIPVESPAINEEGILERISEQNMAIHSEESINEEEPGIIPIDGVQLEDPGEPSGIYQSATAQPVTEVSSSIRGEEGESEDPLVVVPLTKETSQTLSATQSPSLPDTLTSRRHLAPQKRCDIKDFPFSHRAVVSAMVKLTSGMTNLKVPLSGLKHSLKSEFRGAREEFLFSLITKAREEGVLMLKLEEDLVWLVDPRATKASGEVSTWEPLKTI